MNEHLLYVNQKLEASGAKYWLDSGALLGLYRDGGLLPQAKDCDIDFSMIYNREHVKNLFSLIEPDKYRLKTNWYRKNLLDCKIIPQGYTREERFIELKMYRKYKKNYFNIQKIGAPENYPLKKMYELHHFLFKILHRYILTDIAIDSVFWNTLFKFGKFEIPTNFLHRLTSYNVNKHNFPTPNPIEEYLGYRYGTNWRNPNANWNGAWSNDGATKFPVLPETFFPN